MNKNKYHTCDIVALAKHTTGEWKFDLINGTITDKTGNPIPIYLNDGYYYTKTTHQGKRIHIPIHRALYAVALGIYGIPIDYSLEIDHINHIRTDNRISNLRLIHHKENCQNPLPPRKISAEEAVALVRSYATGRCSISMLALEYNCSRKTVRRLIRAAGLRREKC